MSTIAADRCFQDTSLIDVDFGSRNVSDSTGAPARPAYSSATLSRISQLTTCVGSGCGTCMLHFLACAAGNVERRCRRPHQTSEAPSGKGRLLLLHRFTKEVRGFRGRVVASASTASSPSSRFLHSAQTHTWMPSSCCSKKHVYSTPACSCMLRRGAATCGL